MNVSITNKVGLADQKLTIELSTLSGSIEYKKLFSLRRPPMQNLMELSKWTDPRIQVRDTHNNRNRNVESLARLKSIHFDAISNAIPTGTANEVESLLILFGVSSLYISYFKLYELHTEIWGCQIAWMNLLRLRYHAIINLYAHKEGLKKANEANTEEVINGALTLARRDWLAFCMDRNNQFLFSSNLHPESEVTWLQLPRIESVENEVSLIVRRPDQERTPYPYYLSDKTGGRVLERIISEWYLRDRADSSSSLNLVSSYIWSTAPKIRRVVTLTVLSLYILSLMVACLLFREISLLQLSLLLLYVLVPGLFILGTIYRSLMALLVPRMWAAVAVGYLPLLLASGTWKTIYPDPLGNQHWENQGYIPVLFNVACLLVSFIYLQWHVKKLLLRTPNLDWWVPYLRAGLLTVWGLIVSFITGAVLLDVFGSSLARGNSDNWQQFGTTGLIGNVHLIALVLLAPLALLIGVIVQIFWEEKSVTETF